MIQMVLELKEKKKSIKTQLLEVLDRTGRWIVSHEFRDYGVPVNDHAANARLNELRLAGKVESRRRKGTDYVEFHRVLTKTETNA